MKKLLLLSLLLCALLHIRAAEWTDSNGVTWSFTATQTTATITGHTPKSTATLVIPSKVYIGSIDYKVTSIGSFAFRDCSGLTSVTIPSSVTDIGYYAFSGCSGLTSVTIPEGVTSIGYDAFEGCTGLTSVTINSNAIMSKTYSTSSNIGTIFGSQVKEYIIGEGVTSIGYRAFSGCTGLKSVTIPEGVATIGSYAFSGCYLMRSVTIPSSVTIIGHDAFEGCSRLTSVTINSNALMSNNYGITESLCHVFGNQVKEYIIGEGVTSIGNAAFSGCSSLTSVTIPLSVTTIGHDAFYGCSSLTSITISSNLTYIGIDAFKNAKLPVVTVVVADMDTFCESKVIGLVKKHLNKPVILADSEGNKITEFVIPEGVTSIGESAFYNCTGLTSVTIPSSVTSIGESAFYGCTGLTSVTIPSSVTDIGYYAFLGCSRLMSVIVPVKDLAAFCNNHVIGLILSRIDSYRVTLTLIDRDGNEITEYVIPSSVTSIGHEAFSHCSGLTSVTIPSSVTSIGHEAFSHCSGLTSVTIPSSVTSIYYRAFEGCSGLTSVTIPSSVKSIGNYAFIGCSGLTSVTIREGVMSIGIEVFYDCTGLESVTIPESVNEIGNGAFGNCPSLAEVYCYVPIPLRISRDTFSNRFRAILYVPEGCRNDYVKALYWEDFPIITEMAVFTGIEDAWYDATLGKTMKVFKDGRVKILKDGKVYDLNGTREK